VRGCGFSLPVCGSGGRRWIDLFINGVLIGVILHQEDFDGVLFL